MKEIIISDYCYDSSDYVEMITGNLPLKKSNTQ